MLRTYRKRPERPTQLSRLELIAVSALQALKSIYLPAFRWLTLTGIGFGGPPGLNPRQYMSKRFRQNKNLPFLRGTRRFSVEVFRYDTTL